MWQEPGAGRRGGGVVAVKVEFSGENRLIHYRNFGFRPGEHGSDEP